jgi:N-acetyl-gamma-glutamyl-phosphate reductase
MTKTIFIDGEVGTTGLQIRERLAPRTDVTLLSLDDKDRKSPAQRAEASRAADLVVLCLPDDAAREAMTWIEPAGIRVIDASTAHRTNENWVYGFPELRLGHADLIATARRVSNPGCYSTGAIALLKPLVAKGILSADHPVSIHAISGYSGGGRQLIERFEHADRSDRIDSSYYLYGLALRHKHVPEIEVHAGLQQRPLFVPSVGRFHQGMAVQIPLHLATLMGKCSVADIRALYQEWYAGSQFIEVMSFRDCATMENLDPEILNGTNALRVHVFGDDDTGHAFLVAVLDNLGKGASGAAVQNVNLMLGLDPTTGLQAA